MFQFKVAQSDIKFYRLSAVAIRIQDESNNQLGFYNPQGSGSRFVKV